jgi:hypothetical protein
LGSAIDAVATPESAREISLDVTRSAFAVILEESTRTASVALDGCVESRAVLWPDASFFVVIVFDTAAALVSARVTVSVRFEEAAVFVGAGVIVLTVSVLAAGETPAAERLDVWTSREAFAEEETAA